MMMIYDINCSEKLHACMHTCVLPTGAESKSNSWKKFCFSLNSLALCREPLRSEEPRKTREKTRGTAHLCPRERKAI